MRRQSQKEQHDKQAKFRYFEVGDAVYTRNFGYGPKWVQGEITEITGPVSYRVSLENSQRQHVDQLFS